MKKLMIAAAIVCAAAMSQAAAVDWNFKDYTEESDFANYTVYCIAGALQEKWESVDAVKDAALPNGGSAVVVEGKRSTETGDVSSWGSALTKDSGYFFVIVNDTEDKFGVFNGDVASVYDPDKQESSPGTFIFDSDSVTVNSSFGGGPGPEPIPEPTSGLLLLLGVAGLALRRRRA